jgi:hypothetical protein
MVMDSTDTRPDCDCPLGRLLAAAGTAEADARAADGDGDAAAPGAAYPYPVNADGCTICHCIAQPDGDTCCAHGHPCPACESNRQCDGYTDSNGRGFAWYRTRTGWRYVMEYRLQVV